MKPTEGNVVYFHRGHRVFKSESQSDFLLRNPVTKSETSSFLLRASFCKALCGVAILQDGFREFFFLLYFALRMFSWWVVRRIFCKITIGLKTRVKRYA